MTEDPAHPENAVVTRRQLVMVGGIMGVVLGLTLVGVVVIALRVNSIQQQGIRSNAKSIQRLDRVTGDLRKLTHPTKAQYRVQLREGFKRCAAEPTCRVILRRLLEPGAAGRVPTAPRARSTAGPGARTGTGARTRLRHGGSAPRTVADRPRNRRHRRRPRSQNPPGQSSPPLPSSPSITAPLPVTVCTNLLRVNCP